MLVTLFAFREVDPSFDTKDASLPNVVNLRNDASLGSNSNSIEFRGVWIDLRLCEDLPQSTREFGLSRIVRCMVEHDLRAQRSTPTFEWFRDEAGVQHAKELTSPGFRVVVAPYSLNAKIEKDKADSGNPSSSSHVACNYYQLLRDDPQLDLKAPQPRFNPDSPKIADLAVLKRAVGHAHQLNTIRVADRAKRVARVGVFAWSPGIWFVDIETYGSVSQRAFSWRVVSNDAVFPILDAHGLPRTAADDARWGQTMNLVSGDENLSIRGTKLPFIVPVPPSTAQPNSQAIHEAIVVPESVLLRFDGAVAIRKSASWQPLMNDITIGGCEGDRKDLLFIVISDHIADEELRSVLKWSLDQDP
jgi:hypothetical protein